MTIIPQVVPLSTVSLVKRGGLSLKLRAQTPHSFSCSKGTDSEGPTFALRLTTLFKLSQIDKSDLFWLRSTAGANQVDNGAHLKMDEGFIGVNKLYGQLGCRSGPPGESELLGIMLYRQPQRQSHQVIRRSVLSF